MFNGYFNTFVSCQIHKSLKSFVMTIFVSCQTHKFQKKMSSCIMEIQHFRVMSYAQIKIKNENKTLVMTIFAPCQSLPIRKKCSSCISKIKFFVPLWIKIFTKNACHDHILVMSNSQIPQKRQPSTMEIQHFQVISVSLNS